MTTTNTTNWDNKELGVLWKRESQTKKEKYLTGVINLKSLGFDKDVSIIIFSNKTKKKDTHPDLRIYVSEKRTAAVSKAPALVKTETQAVPVDNELI